MSHKTPTVHEPDDVQLARGIILCLLAEAYPRLRVESGLKAELAEARGDIAGWEQHVAYLADDGYIEVTAEKIGTRYGKGITLRSLRITTHGLDLVDGRISDLGVFVGEE